MQHIHQRNPPTESMTVSSIDTTEVQLGESMSCIGIACGNTAEGLFTGAEMIQRQLHHRSPPQYGGQLTKAGKLEYTAQPSGSSADCWASSPSNSVGLNHFQTA